MEKFKSMTAQNLRPCNAEFIERKDSLKTARGRQEKKGSGDSP
jgi:hypothetical protein